MKDLFEDEKSEQIEEVKEIEEPISKCDKWWIKKKCSVCGSDNKLWVRDNGIIRCEEHYRDKK